MRVYQIIKDASLHKNAITLALAPIATREFGQWAMGHRVSGREELLELSQESWLVEQNQRGPEVQPSIGPSLLRQFWHGREGTLAN